MLLRCLISENVYDPPTCVGSCVGALVASSARDAYQTMWHADGRAITTEAF